MVGVELAASEVDVGSDGVSMITVLVEVVVSPAPSPATTGSSIGSGAGATISSETAGALFPTAFPAPANKDLSWSSVTHVDPIQSFFTSSSSPVARVNVSSFVVKESAKPATVAARLPTLATSSCNALTRYGVNPA